jgi:hypothetical protein
MVHEKVKPEPIFLEMRVISSGSPKPVSMMLDWLEGCG